MGDERASWRPSAYGYTLGGCRLSLEFPIVKLLDYEQQWQTLEESNNPFAVLIMAHLKTKATISEPQERKQWKWSLFRRLFERGYNREEIIILFRCIDQMMALPEELETQFEQEVDKYQEDRNMPLLSRREERVKQEGIQQGIQQGTLQTLQELLINILQKQLGEMPPDLLDAAINGVTDISFLRQLFERAFDLGSWEEFQQLLSSKNYER